MGQTTQPTQNEIGMQGIDFVEFASTSSDQLQNLFFAFGFSKLAKHSKVDAYYYKQNDIHFFINQQKTGFAHEFTLKHGPCVSSMGWRFANPQQAYDLAISRGAKAAKGDYTYKNGQPVLAIYGIGESLIYFVAADVCKNNYQELGFMNLDNPMIHADKGFSVIDHLTNNVYNGTMEQWAQFYKKIFGFTEVRYFDIRGAKTGLTSYALKSPCGHFCIPINEAKENKSQINEYLEEYKGPGVQHIAFLTTDILNSLNGLADAKIEMLDMDDEYYKDVFEKFPQITEDKEDIKRKNVLVDGDEEGYLLQIFTKNLIGPIFIEIIQRKNHYAFGEGNFGALFRSIERDQMKRGVL